mgnify:CR=1 FL=1
MGALGEAGEGAKAAGGESVGGRWGAGAQPARPQGGPTSEARGFRRSRKGLRPVWHPRSGRGGAGEGRVFWNFFGGGFGLRGRGRKGLGKSGGLSECRGRGSESSGRGKHWGKAGGRGAARPPQAGPRAKLVAFGGAERGCAPFGARRAQKTRPPGRAGIGQDGVCGGTGI